MNSRILPSIALLISAAMLFAYVGPTWSGSIAATKAAIDSDNQALAAASAYKARETELASERDSIDPANLTRLTTFLPDSVDNVGLILDINALAARSGLMLANVDVAADTTGGAAAPTTSSGGTPSVNAVSPIGSVDLSLSATGSYTAFKTFLIGIEKSARLLDVQDILVTGSDTGVYNYHMTMRLYWLR